MQFYSFLVSGAFCDFFNFQTISCFAMPEVFGHFYIAMILELGDLYILDTTN